MSSNELPIPKLEDYDINPVSGFLPNTPPLKRLPSYYEPWEEIVDNITALLLAGRFRKLVAKLPTLETDKLSSLKEYQRAYVVLCFIAHSYVWGKNQKVSQVLPSNLSIPFTKISAYLGIHPVITNASAILWNWKLMDPSEPISLNNLATQFTFTGSTDESWFYLVSVAIEALGGQALLSIIESIQAVRENSKCKVAQSLLKLRVALLDINSTLKQMYEQCDPYVFYWKIRPYLAGWENMEEAGLPYGLLYEGVDDVGFEGSAVPPSCYRKYAGGSAGQSALIQAFDIALGIAHYPTSEEWKKYKEEDRQLKEQGLPSKKHTHTTYLYSMRAHMPGLHRQFLEDLTKVANLHSFVEKVGGDCGALYNECIDALKKFRDIHIQIVTKYIVLPAKKGPSMTSFSISGDLDNGIPAQFNKKFIQSPELVPTKPSQDSSHSFSSDEGIVPSLTRTNSGNNSETPSTVPTPQSSSPALDTQNLKSLASFKDINLAKLDRAATIGSKIAALKSKSHPQPITKSHSDHGIAKMLTGDDDVVRGTGGTDLIPFLKQVRDETLFNKV